MTIGWHAQRHAVAVIIPLGVPERWAPPGGGYLPAIQCVRIGIFPALTRSAIQDPAEWLGCDVCGSNAEEVGP